MKLVTKNRVEDHWKFDQDPGANSARQEESWASTITPTEGNRLLKTFLAWIRRFDDYICATPNRKAVLLIYSCCAHRKSATLSSLQFVEIDFLSPSMKSKLQRMDTVNIAVVKVRYRRAQMERALDLIDVDVKDI